MNGLEGTRKIHATESGSNPHLPILALTANAFEEDRHRCLAAGMDGFLSKPVTPSALRDEIARIVSTVLTPQEAN